MQPKKAKGNACESIASSWLVSQGYTQLDTNYARRLGEIDLIMQHPDGVTIVFVEVRFRSNHGFGGAIASVDYKKQIKLVKTANAWLQRYADSMTPARIDVIGVGPLHDNVLAQGESRFGQNPIYIWQDHELTWIENAIER